MGVYGKTFAQFNTHQAIDHQTFVFPNGVTVSGGNQTMNCNYQVGNVDVFVRGIKMAESEFTADDGTSVSIPVATLSMTTGDEITIIGRKYPTADIMNSGAVNISGGQVNNTTMNNSTLTNATISSGTLGSSVVVPASIGASVVHLNTTTISSAVGDVQFDNTLITTTYDYYVVVMQGVSSSGDNFDLYAHLSIDNGSSKVSHRSNSNYHRLNGATAEGWTADTDHLVWEDGEGDLSGGSGGGFAVFELLIPPSVAGVDAVTRSWGAVQNQNGDFYGYTTTGVVTTSSSSARINHLKFDETNGNNIDAGKFSLYAYKL